MRTFHETSHTVTIFPAFPIKYLAQAHISKLGLMEGLRQTTNGLKPERFSERHGPCVGADDEIELHTAKSATFVNLPPFWAVRQTPPRRRTFGSFSGIWPAAHRRADDQFRRRGAALLLQCHARTARARSPSGRRAQAAPGTGRFERGGSGPSPRSRARPEVCILPRRLS